MEQEPWILSLDEAIAQYDKRLKGQFFTTTNPFVNEAFVKWLHAINKLNPSLLTIVEPFAGSNNIVWMVREMGFKNPWVSFDIQPPEDNSAEDVLVSTRDTLKDYPKNYKVAITNPPYLAKNSATSRGMPYAGGEYEDLYQKALAVMLENTDYVAAIIPETFIKQNLFHNRLSAVVSLTCQMFDDTAHPVCLALFIPESDKKVKSDFDIWQDNRLIGRFKTFESYLKIPKVRRDWSFNEPNGLIGLKGADGAKTEDIAFVLGNTIPSESVKPSSRHNTRISASTLTEAEAIKIIGIANRLLKARRKITKDVFMTAHRGLREDGKYRRRLEFSQARDILDLACMELNGTGTIKKDSV